MEQKQFVLNNRGMNRDLSVSKTGQATAYDNHNIRILARDNDTLLSVTNERGNAQISLSGTIVGTLIGWNVLNNHVILFTHASSGENPDYIYRIDYTDDGFVMVKGEYPNTDTSKYALDTCLYRGDLGFTTSNPIESIVYYETEDIQKIYWVDGKNVLRMLNFVASLTEASKWDNDYFDSNRWIKFNLNVAVSKDNSGNPRPNGVIQYLITYFNKHGQETGYAWISDLIYLSPTNVGGSADGTNLNRVTLTLGVDTPTTAQRATQPDDRYTGIRVYSIFRSSYDGQVTAYLVGEHNISSKTESVSVHYGSKMAIIDDGSHLTAIDPTSLLFLGSRNVVPETMTYKDSTLFLGNLNTTGAALPGVEAAIRANMFANSAGTQTAFVEGTTWQAACVTFAYSDDTAGKKHIPYVENTGSYPYNNQLEYTSSVITTFKGGEKYRFGLMFRMDNGVNSEVYWIGDKVNTLYPVTVSAQQQIKRAIAICTIPTAVITAVRNCGLGVRSVQLMVAEASYADRSIKAQGIINPTTFNVWDRYNDNLYSIPSWISRPRRSGYAYKHFEPIHNATRSTGEIECNYWETEDTPTPYYRVKNYFTADAEYMDTFEGMPSDENDFLMLVYGLQCYRGDWGQLKYLGRVYVVRAKILNSNVIGTESAYIAALKAFDFSQHADLFPTLSVVKNKTYYDTGASEGASSRFSIDILGSWTLYGKGKKDTSLRSVYTSITDWLEKTGGVDTKYLVSFDVFSNTWGEYCNSHRGTTYYWNSIAAAAENAQKKPELAANTQSNSETIWWDMRGNNKSKAGPYIPAYYRKHLMFVDENVVTLDSPEIFYETVSLDNADECKLRIIGVAKVSGCVSDDIIDGSQGMLSGENHVKENFSGFDTSSYLDGLQSWPLWEEYGLAEKPNNEEEEFEVPSEVKERSSIHYTKGAGTVRYWMHMWNHTGLIDGYSDEDVTVFDGDAYSKLRKKIFANLKFCYSSIYSTSGLSMELSALRIFNYTSSQYVGLKIGDDNEFKTRYYDAVINTVLTPPGDIKYPISFNTSAPLVGEEIEASGSFLYGTSAIPMTYSTSAHAVMSFESSVDTTTKKYTQTILPYIRYKELAYTIDGRDEAHSESGPLLPWINTDSAPINYIYGEAVPTVETPPVDPGYIRSIPSPSVTSINEINHTISILWSALGVNLQYQYLYKYTWRPAIEYFSGQPVYYKMYVSGKGNIIVDISKAVFSMAGMQMRIEMAHYFDAESTDTEQVVVNYANFDNSESTTPLTSGFGRLVTGQASSTSNSGITIIDPSQTYPYIDYDIHQDYFTLTTDSQADDIGSSEKYLFIGEIYQDYDSSPLTDMRYGGISLDAVANCRFVAAGPQTNVETMSTSSASGNIVIGNQGDTYFQRFDALRTKPLSESSENGVIDITSAMLETHINIDGRHDLQRGLRHIASLDTEQFNLLNRVYSQPNNFIVGRDPDNDSDNDKYSSTVTWTLDKHDAANIDEWMHITLADTLKLNGEKGACNALRRYQNAIIAFQDRCLSEILFNSRVQINASDGVPIEIANSGKVDGKRTISDKHGCVNKWSVVEGKTGLYFVDNVNKIFASFDGSGVNNISDQKGFSVWFKNKNNMKPWTPAQFNNLVAYYDRIHSDIYLVGATDSTTGQSCLVYSEPLQEFTSFFDYGNVPMMANVSDKFISAYPSGSNTVLWLQNEGNRYCKFFGTQYNFWTEHRVAPDMYMDKVWTGLEYRADFYRIGGDNSITESNFDTETYYQPTETFDKFKAWNEYQSTPETTIPQAPADAYPDVRKKFRIWRLDMPRAVKDNTYNKNGLNRMRNPWLQFRLTRTLAGNDNKAKDLMQLHDIIVNYFE